jgi:hypothetical protein
MQVKNSPPLEPSTHPISSSRNMMFQLDKNKFHKIIVVDNFLSPRYTRKVHMHKFLLYFQHNCRHTLWHINAFRKLEFNGTSRKKLCSRSVRINREIDVPQLPNEFQLLQKALLRPCRTTHMHAWRNITVTCTWKCGN